MLHFKKEQEQLSRQVEERRDARIFKLQKREVREAREAQERLRVVKSATVTADSPASKVNAKLLAEADDFIDLVASSGSPCCTPCKKDKDNYPRVVSPSPTKKKRTPEKSSSPVLPDGRVITRIIFDTPLLRLIEALIKRHNNTGVYPPPCCDSAKCGYSTGCLHGQRLALAKRLVELEFVLFGKNPGKFGGFV